MKKTTARNILITLPAIGALSPLLMKGTKDEKIFVGVSLGVLGLLVAIGIVGVSGALTNGLED
jgi:hypothetical protein